MALERDDFDISRCAWRAERLDPQLMELSLAPRLRSLTTEHRAEVVEASVERLGAPSRHVTHDAGGPFGAQGEASAAAVFERIHFFPHDIRRIAERPGKDVGLFEEGRPNFGETIEGQNLAGEFFHSLPADDFRRTEIRHALDGLERGRGHEAKAAEDQIPVMIFLITLPGLNLTTFRAGIVTTCKGLLGLRPMRCFRSRTSKTPKFLNSTFSPLARFSTI